MTRVLVTGGAGFIGSNFVRYALQTHADWHVTNLDKLTYAGRRENLHDVMDNPRHTFVHGDILDAAVAGPLVEAADYVVHFAAETHVDRSIMSAGDFIKTDVEGSFVLLEAARRNPGLKRFVQISTDEVYGSVPEGSSTETDELKPRVLDSVSHRRAVVHLDGHPAHALATNQRLGAGPQPRDDLDAVVGEQFEQVAADKSGRARNQDGRGHQRLPYWASM